MDYEMAYLRFMEKVYSFTSTPHTHNIQIIITLHISTLIFQTYIQHKCKLIPTFHRCIDFFIEYEWMCRSEKCFFTGDCVLVRKIKETNKQLYLGEEKYIDNKSTLMIH
jgi:hypothetical protein